MSRKQIDQAQRVGKSAGISLRQGAAITLTDAERQQLQQWVRGRTTPQRLVLRSWIVLLASSGLSIRRIARELPTSVRTVVLWRRRFLEGGAKVLLRDAPGRGRRSSVPRELHEAIAAERPSSHGTRAASTVRAVAAKYGVSRSVVHRIWSEAQATTETPTRVVRNSRTKG
jgi:transposase